MTGRSELSLIGEGMCPTTNQDSRPGVPGERPHASTNWKRPEQRHRPPWRHRQWPSPTEIRPRQASSPVPPRTAVGCSLPASSHLPVPSYPEPRIRAREPRPRQTLARCGHAQGVTPQGRSSLRLDRTNGGPKSHQRDVADQSPALVIGTGVRAPDELGQHAAHDRSQETIAPLVVAEHGDGLVRVELARIDWEAVNGG